MRYLILLGLLASASTANAQPTQRPWLGVGIQNGAGGVVVTEVINGTPADDAGVKPGDVITRVDNVKVATTQALIRQIGLRQVGSSVHLRVSRVGKTLLLKAMLDRRLSREELLNRRLLGTLAPDFELAVMTKAGTKGKVRLSSLRGKVVILEFWASYCQYCKKVHPVLSKLQNKYRQQGVVVLGLAEDTASTLRSHLAKPRSARDIDFATLHDSNGAIKRMYFVQSIPTIIVIDAKGVVRFAGVGAGGTMGNAISVVEHCVKHPAP